VASLNPFRNEVFAGYLRRDPPKLIIDVGVWKGADIGLRAVRSSLTFGHLPG
jgi:hypothetical protein